MTLEICPPTSGILLIINLWFLFCFDIKLTKVVQSHFFSTEKYARMSHFSLKQTLKNSAHSLQEEPNKKSYFYRNLNVESFVHCCIHPFFCASKVSATVHWLV